MDNTPQAPHFRQVDDGLLLFCHIQPGASADEFAGRYGDRLKIRIQSAAIEGKANHHLRQFLATAFGVSTKQVLLQKGENSWQKTLFIRQPRIIPSASFILYTR